MKNKKKIFILIMISLLLITILLITIKKTIEISKTTNSKDIISKNNISENILAENSIKTENIEKKEENINTKIESNSIKIENIVEDLKKENGENKIKVNVIKKDEINKTSDNKEESKKEVENKNNINKEEPKKETESKPKPIENKEDTSNKKNETLANTSYRKKSREAISEVVNYLNNIISKDKSFTEIYESTGIKTKAIETSKNNAYNNTSRFTYMLVKDIKKGKVAGNYIKFIDRLNSHVGAVGTYNVYAEDEFTYDSDGINAYWTQTLVWIYIN